MPSEGHTGGTAADPKRFSLSVAQIVLSIFVSDEIRHQYNILVVLGACLYNGKQMTPEVSDFEQKYGRPLTAQQVGLMLGLDPRTVRKYAANLGGVEIFPGTVRFFEKLLKERIDHALDYNEERNKEISALCDGRREKKIRSTYRRRQQGQFSLGSHMGKKEEEGDPGSEIQKHHGIRFG